MQRLASIFAHAPKEPLPDLDTAPDEEPLYHERKAIARVEFVSHSTGKYQPRTNEAVVGLLRRTLEPIAFELVSTADSVIAQATGASDESVSLQEAVQTYFPDVATIDRNRDFLSEETKTDTWIVIDFGYEREWLHQLRSADSDPFVAIIAAMQKVRDGEVAVYQVLFERCEERWREALFERLLAEDGTPVFSNAKHFLQLTGEKCRDQLFAVSVRLAVRTQTFERGAELLSNIVPSFATFADPEGNALVPLSNEEYPASDHVEDLVLRQSRRYGMLMTTAELAQLVHVPSGEVRSAKLKRQQTTTKAAPAILVAPPGLFLGINRHAGKEVRVHLSDVARVRHTYLVGASGTGKSTLLLNLISQDLALGTGVGVIDPHGDLIDAILERIPEERVNDVVLIDPSDADYVVGFNILQARDEFERTLLASDVVGIFERMSTSWGDQLGTVFRAAVLAFLESEHGGTLVELRRFLADPAYRSAFLKTVGDEDVVTYWQKTFPLLTGNKSIGPILTRLEMFLSQRVIREMVSQRKKGLDFSALIDTRRIVLVKLSQGLLGRENSQLLGSLIMAKFQQAAMARQRIKGSERPLFALYADEFQDYISPSLADILVGARKYNFALTLAHQDLQQLEKVPEVASAVRNAYTHVCFRVSDRDSRVLEKGFRFFTAQELQNLGIGQAICKVERAEYDFNLEIPATMPPFGVASVNRVVTTSRHYWGTPRREAPPVPAFDPPEDPQKPATAPEKESPAEAPAITPRKIEENREELPKVNNHQRLKEMLAAEGKRYGFAVSLERPVSNGEGRIDVVLERGDIRVACEVSFTTPLQNEVTHVIRCLREPYSHVALVCEDAARLSEIREAVKRAVKAPEIDRIMFSLPAGFIDALRKLSDRPESPLPQPPAQFTSDLSHEERRNKERDLLKRLAENLKKSRKR